MTDAAHMRRALELAEGGRYSVSPNPMVGCVVVRDGSVVGEGYHHRAGMPHAEVVALKEASGRLEGATVYVTLEPCSHTGRTPPCVNALVEARIGRVVVATEDPNTRVNGRGIARLLAAGIEVETGVLREEAERLNERFLYSARRNRPFVLLKAGMTLDGKLATVMRESQWITSPESRERSLRLREEYDAVLVGGGTVSSDDPKLTRRMGLNGAVTPWTRVIVDGAGNVPLSSNVLADEERTLLFTSFPGNYRGARNTEIVGMEAPGGKLDLAQVLAQIHQRGIQSVIAEGGSALHSSLIAGGLVQKLIFFVAPALIGGADAPSVFSGPAVEHLTGAHRFRFDAVERVGSDLMITAYPE